MHPSRLPSASTRCPPAMPWSGIPARRAVPRGAFAVSAAALMGLAGPAALAATPPADVEQYSLELINRARQDPRHEVWRFRADTWGDTAGGAYPAPQTPDLSEGGAAANDTPKQPLAFNTSLVQAARDYSTTLLTNNSPLTHTYGGTTPQTRTQAAGYVYGGASSWGENLAIGWSSGAYNISQAVAADQHQGLFVDGDVTGRGHRTNILAPAWKEVGIGFAQKSGYSGYGGSYNAVLSTYDFAYSGGSSSGRAFITGLAYSDAVTDDNFYTPGEGLAGVTVTATPTAGGTSFTTTTFGSGGYSLPVPAGTYNVTLSGAGLSSTVTYHSVAVGTSNVKLDAASDMGVFTGTSGAAWSGSGNWGGLAGGPNGVGQQAVFANRATSLTNVTLDVSRTVGTIVFRNTLDASWQVLPAGGASLTFDVATDNARVDLLSGNGYLNVPIQLNDSLDVTVLGSPDSLTMSQPFTSNGAGKAVNKFGKGLLRLAGSNSFSGGLSIVEGRVAAINNQALGTASQTATLGFLGNSAELGLALAGANVNTPVLVAAGTGNRLITTLIGSGTATLSGAITLQAGVTLSSSPGSVLAVSGPISDDGGNWGVATIGGAVTLLGTNAYHGNTTVKNNSTLVLGGSVTNSASLEVLVGTARLAADQALKNLSIDKSASGPQVLDLNHKAARVYAGSPAQLAALETQLLTQINGGTAADGIYDATLAAGNAVGITDQASDAGGQHVLVRQTLLGDADVNGTVAFGDLLVVAQNYDQATGMTWDTGDFDLNGAVAFADLLVVAQNYDQSVAPAAVPGASAEFNADWARALATVPEPGALAFAGAGALLLRRRRRYGGAAAEA